MPIQEWSESIMISEPEEEPALSDELDALTRRIEGRKPGEAPDVVIDMKSVHMVNSSNIAQLLKVRKVLQERGARLRVCSMNDQVWSVIMVTGLDKVFDFTEDIATSIASLQIEAE